jgi:thiopeptide-type bacteriocin biosynthesis protein
VADIFRTRYAHEFGTENGPTGHKLGDKFRLDRKQLESLLDPIKDADSSLSAGIMVLKERTEQLRPMFQEMLKLQDQGKLTHRMEDMIGDFVHMSVNRLLRSAQRMQEMVIYDFLVRLYDSRLARERKAKHIG